MAEDKKQYREACHKWELLDARRRFSVAPELGMTAVIYAQYDTVQSEDEEEVKQIESVVFSEEAKRIADYINASGGNAFTIKGLTSESLEEGVIKNINVANVVVISHGNLSAVYSDAGTLIEWAEVADMTTHLKTGYFEQRFCGHFRRELSVPFGMLAVSEARNVFAPAGTNFNPEINADDENLLQPITTSRRLSYKQIKELFPRQICEDDSSD